MSYAGINSNKISSLYKSLRVIGPHTFTAREVDVMSCINNRGDKKIAAILANITYRTVSSHVRNISNKISARSRHEIIESKKGFLNSNANERLLYFAVDYKLFEKFFNLIELIFLDNKKDISELHKSFQEEIAKILPSQKYQQLQEVYIKTNLKRYMFLIVFFVTFVAIASKFYFAASSSRRLSQINYHFTANNEQNHLPRESLLMQIDSSFANSTDAIKIVILEGVIGSGKKTLAKNYLQHHAGSNLTWIIDCSTYSKILTNLQNLANALCQSEADYMIIKKINECTNKKEKEIKITDFL